MEWISNAKSNQELTEGTVFKLKGRTDICIHNIHGLGNEFFLTCRHLGVESRDLKTENFNVAVENTKVIVQHKLKVLSELYADFIEGESDNVFVRY